MASSIPFSPALVLGNLVPQSVLDAVDSIAVLQEPIDTAKDTLNALIATRRSLDMTIQELIDLNVASDDMKDIIQSRLDLNSQIAKAASDYGKKQTTSVEAIQQKKSAMVSKMESVESPIDYNRTQIKRMPLSADSLTMDVQYFSFDEDAQSAKSTVATIKGYISDQTSYLGEDMSASITTSAGTQLSSQLENHEVAGTLVITANCTHKDAVLLAPFILDVDKAIRVWNALPSNANDKLNPEDVASLQKIANQTGTDKEADIKLISGATYGSSFVGMVHILRKESTSSSQSMISLAASLQAQFAVGGWFAKESGGFGVDSSFANDIKNLLSSQNITSHISLITMGAIPSIKSNEVQIGVQTFADFDPAKMMDKLATLANATATDQKSVAASAAAAQTGQQMLAIQGSTVTNVMTGLAKIDDGKNQILDINSLMSAFQDYVDKAIAGNVGVPINYYLKSITKSQLAQMWVAKYYPNKFLSISGDDSTPANGGNASAPANGSGNNS